MKNSSFNFTDWRIGKYVSFLKRLSPDSQRRMFNILKKDEQWCKNFIKENLDYDKKVVEKLGKNILIKNVEQHVDQVFDGIKKHFEL